MTSILTTIAEMQREDLHAIAAPALLERTHDLFAAKKMVDAEIARSLQTMDVREVAITETGFTTRTWMIYSEHIGPGESSKRMAVARALPSYPLLAETLAAGDISHEHAAAIADTLRRLDVEDRQARRQGHGDAAANEERRSRRPVRQHHPSGWTRARAGTSRATGHSIVT